MSGLYGILWHGLPAREKNTAKMAVPRCSTQNSVQSPMSAVSASDGPSFTFRAERSTNMTDPHSSNHWDSLASDLGAKPAAEEAATKQPPRFHRPRRRSRRRGRPARHRRLRRPTGIRWPAASASRFRHPFRRPPRRESCRWWRRRCQRRQLRLKLSLKIAGPRRRRPRRRNRRISSTSVLILRSRSICWRRPIPCSRRRRRPGNGGRETRGEAAPKTSPTTRIGSQGFARNIGGYIGGCGRERSCRSRSRHERFGAGFDHRGGRRDRRRGTRRDIDAVRGTPFQAPAFASRKEEAIGQGRIGAGHCRRALFAEGEFASDRRRRRARLGRGRFRRG